jgi:integrase/recombinase XerD
MEGEEVMKILTDKMIREVYHEYLVSNGYKEKSIQRKMLDVEILLKYLSDQESIADFRDVTADHIRGLIKHLHKSVNKKTGRYYSDNYKAHVLSTANQVFSSLYIEELILLNPVKNLDIQIKRVKKRKEILSEEEMNTFLDSIDIGAPYGLRDRAIFELIYATGMRGGEVSDLNVEDIDFKNRHLFIREGKMSKDRVVPVSEVAIRFLKLYLSERKEQTGRVFFTKYGRIDKTAINNRFRWYAERCGLYRKGLSNHSIRHSTAVHLLANGADLRYVQELLGHESIETTVLYTHQLFDNLKRIYRSFHPRENEYYKEIDDVYLKQLDLFEERLRERLKKREYHRQNRERYDANRKAPRKRKQ